MNAALEMLRTKLDACRTEQEVNECVCYARGWLDCEEVLLETDADVCASMLAAILSAAADRKRALIGAALMARGRAA